MEEGYTEVANAFGDVLQYKLFTLNDQAITVASVLWFIGFLIGFYLLSKLVNNIILRRILIRFDIERSIRYNMTRIGHYAVMVIGTMFAFQFVGLDLSSLTVVFGLLSVGIGFGLQNITSNFISGVILLFERPIKVGDRVTVGDVEGDVAAIGMRATTINSLQNITIIVPNSEFISAQVTNWSYGDPKIRVDINVGVSYNSDLDTVIKALSEVAEEHPRILSTIKPQVLLMAFGDSSWDMQLRFWLASPDGLYRVRSDINCAIVRKFREHGVEIPFPQRDLHVRSPLPVPFSRGEDV
ncbi:MAG: mechanosensitive ion channel [candidate division Zixibacteria bacterium]|nr:mechanosensitive ion channel [candidate division Zixibacteria bacterium]